MKVYERQEYIERLAEEYEVPVEQLMIAYAVIEVSQNEGYWDSYYVGDEDTIEGIFRKVFKA